MEITLFPSNKIEIQVYDKSQGHTRLQSLVKRPNGGMIELLVTGAHLYIYIQFSEPQYKYFVGVKLSSSQCPVNSSWRITSKQPTAGSCMRLVPKHCIDIQSTVYMQYICNLKEAPRVHTSTARESLCDDCCNTKPCGCHKVSCDQVQKDTAQAASKATWEIMQTLQSVSANFDSLSCWRKQCQACLHSREACYICDSMVNKPETFTR